MDIRLNEEKTLFLQLAIKKISGTASAQERTELAALLKATPDLERHYHEMSGELELAENEGFVELCLRVLFNEGSPDDESQVRALKQAHAAKWKKFLEIAFILQSLNGSPAAQSSKKSAPTSMPEEVRKRLLAGLRVKQKEK